MSELKPCPFCGGTDLQHYQNGVYCNNPKCEAGLDFGHFCGGNEEEKQFCLNAVADAWNTRTYEETIQSLQEELKSKDAKIEELKEAQTILKYGFASSLTAIRNEEWNKAIDKCKGIVGGFWSDLERHEADEEIVEGCSQVYMNIRQLYRKDEGDDKC